MIDRTDSVGATRHMTETHSTEIQDLVRSRIEDLRPKLLDLSRRNPLISTRFSPRSNSYIRVVDELPDVLWYSLENEKRMRFMSLPPLDDDPRDEQTTLFRDALAEARLTDEAYVQATDAIDPDSETALEQNLQLEWELKDRVRELLNTPARQTKTNVSLSQHARNNHISPSYDLPEPDAPHPDGRHADNTIQTLLLPDDMDRKLNGLNSKCRTWIQETGINVLHAAFGFLEWTESNGKGSAFAPLVLAKVEIDKQRTHNGPAFWVRGTGDEAETNIVLAEKLRLDFGIEIPRYNGGSIEEYLANVAKASPKPLKWKLRRQVAFGVFPSARMAMYHDLDTSQNRFCQSNVVGKLLGGSSEQMSTPYSEEYDVDRPDLETKVPLLVRDADSSQFSALIDIADGRDLAIEGPPGTGKSQTIVNAIAASIAQGKKVLFVAEKTAALDVVKSRLEAIGLGEFALALQADRSAREHVIASVRDRVAMKIPRGSVDYARKTAEFKETRAELTRYIAVLSTSFGSTGLTVHDILGKSMAANEILLGKPKELTSRRIPEISAYDETRVESLRRLGIAVEKSWHAANSAESHWQGHTLLHIDRLIVEQTCELAETAATAFRMGTQTRQALVAFNVDPETSQPTLKLLNAILVALSQAKSLDPALIGRLCRQQRVEEATRYLDACERFQKAQQDLSEIFRDAAADYLPHRLREIETLCNEAGIDTLDETMLGSRVEEETSLLSRLTKMYEKLARFVDIVPESAPFTIPEIIRARELVRDTPREVLALRDKTATEPLATAVISRIVLQGKDLRKRRDDLESIFFATTTLSTTELLLHATTLRRAGRLRYLSSKYRFAKRSYLSVSRRASYNRQLAADDTVALADWQQAEQNFRDDRRASMILGVRFRGVDSDFDLLDGLCTYYHAVEQQFSGIEAREVNSFLKTGHLDFLMSLPDLAETFWHENLDQLKGDIDQRTASVSNLKQATKKLAGLVDCFKEPGTTNVESLDELAQQVFAHLQLNASLDQDQEIEGLLGNHFQGAATDFRSIRTNIEAAQAISVIHDASGSILELLERRRVPDAVMALQSVLATDARAELALEQLCQHTGMDVSYFSSGRTHAELATYLERASEDQDGLYIFSQYAAARHDLAKTGFDWLVEALLAEGQPLDDLGATLEAVLNRARASEVFRIHREILGRSHGERLDELRTRLATLDRQVLRLASSHLRAKAQESAKPPHGNSVGPKSTWTEMALLTNEIGKKKRYVPVRDLTTRAGRALAELKPCWMMSPLAVAQYLPHSEQRFDLCIIDEASQMPPEDSIGALGRSRQAVVVGDTNQLPPTSFFRKMIDDQDAEDETVLDESILELANSAFRPKRRLRWHYRSRHSALIKFSNHMVYNDDLVVFPSPTESRPDMGVRLVSVRGRYHSGTNGEEARTMIDAALQFMRDTPGHSLGLVTLNQMQRDLLREEMEYALSRDTSASKYVDDWAQRNDGLESFFIKNLENVQGDERDVIFIGTVYGPEELGGPVMQRFGPINGVAGKRRLNVLFSRAKQQIVTFSSMTAADIRADENGNPGAYMLKRWLEYCATGVLHTGKPTSKDPDSDFEVFVIDQIRSMGFEPVPQVGVAGYFIDIGVKHPDWPHGFLLGVECDGESYHSSKSARDRDRLRQEVLEGLGWHLYRIWSTDWFNDARKETEKLRQAINGRLESLRNNSDSFATDAQGGVLRVFSEDKEAEMIRRSDPIDLTHEGESHDLFEIGKGEPQRDVEATDPCYVAVGDTVRVRFLSGFDAAFEITLSDEIDARDRGIVHVDRPLGHALVGAEEGDEIPVLVGNVVREAVVERVIKSQATSRDRARQ